MKDEGRRHHDLGGLPAGKVVYDDHEREAWEKRNEDASRGSGGLEMVRALLSLQGAPAASEGEEDEH